MRKATIVLGSMLAMAGGPLLLTTVSALIPAVAFAQQKVSVNVGKPLTAANEAIKRQQWQSALNSIKQAQAVTPRTAFDDYKINELLWYVYLRQGRNAEAAKLLEQQISSPLMPASEKTQRTKTLAQLYFRAGSYGKALQLANQYLKSVPGDREVQLLAAQAYFEQRDYKSAIALAERLVKGQNPPSQDLLQLIARSNYELKDAAGTSRALETLLRYYPSADTWKTVLKGYIDATKNDEQLGALYRLAQDVDAMRANDYKDMAEALTVTGFAMEGERVLEGALTAKVLDEAAAAGATRSLESIRRSAERERAALPGAAKAVTANASAEDMYKSGKLYFSSGDYAKAIDALQKAIAKGGLAKPDDAQALLGIALSRAGRKADAGKAFDAVKSPEYSEIARLWKLAAR
jgi:tetratricopeptide (TPR) repeat protein